MSCAAAVRVKPKARLCEGNNILDESSGSGDDDLDGLVREIFEITVSDYWEHRAREIATLIRSYCRSRD